VTSILDEVEDEEECRQSIFATKNNNIIADS
jgi:hypothetical protein